ncbi:MAG: hypothetical protein U0R66_08375 [Mycobacterium sp.]
MEAVRVAMTGRLIVWAGCGELGAGFTNEERAGSCGADRAVRVTALGAGSLVCDGALV